MTPDSCLHRNGDSGSGNGPGLLIIDEIGYLPVTKEQVNLFSSRSL